MTVSDDIREFHINAEHHNVKFPSSMQFGERFIPTVDESRIPASVYTSRARLAEELEMVWYRTWQMACRVEEVEQAGDFYEYVIGDQSILIVRGDDEVLRAFPNTCRHRGTALKTGTGNAPDLRCSFHAWCWSLRGQVANIPERHLFSDVSDEDYALPQLGCDVWNGFVFVHLKPEIAPPLRDFLGRVATDCDAYHMDRYRATTHARIELDCNWKVAIEAFLEAYHVSFTHPQILAYLDDLNTAFEVFGDHSRMVIPYGVPSMRLEHVDPAETYESYFNRSATSFRHSADEATLPKDLFDADGNWISTSSIREYMIEHARAKGDKLGHDYSQLSAEQLVDDYDYFIFPSLKFNSHAGAALCFRARPHATDPDRCIFDVYTLVWPDETAGELPKSAPAVAVDLATQSMGLVLDQDFSNLAKVQRGLHNSSFEQITLGGSEIRVIHLHRVLNAYLARG